MKTTSRQRLPFELTSRRNLNGRTRQPDEKDIGQIFEWHGRKMIVFRQRTTDIPCKGCYFYESKTRDRDCPPLCEGFKRGDKLDVIFKQILP